ncbi:hypothetical protein BX616_004247 [Lobosporangium transversale]|uniref:Chromo domain-containing protein n=1 Tax=Lobosporangium transversale TaxID=64571 RepID=A0A1Y2GN46_9FUNG|nr:hypothetical protein BCR41DRAFT_354873 [Lobosporangium transversale]KAF9916249.1 hypothetical protein BX616_004247 [Lobosporangium transversale]ORZ14434.1 hypothetical protein BCR41DRAFT_354873 [Lobosporangium transversale]|eukprot:XP_021880912.1 hypothetical protein BCR41DRAFT_354873 [Lobosporangium transversale]
MHQDSIAFKKNNETANSKGDIAEVDSASESFAAEEIEDESEAEEYEVERVDGHRRDSSGKLSFLLKWKGYSDKDSTWEKSENLSCEELIEAYWERYEAKGGNRDDRYGKAPKTKGRPAQKRGAGTKANRVSTSPAAQQTRNLRRHSSSSLSRTSLVPEENGSQAQEVGENLSGIGGDGSLTNSAPKKRKIEDVQEGLQSRGGGNIVDESDKEAKKIQYQGDESTSDNQEDNDNDWEPPTTWTSWEEHVDYVQTVEQSEKMMVVYLMWKNGKSSVHPVTDAHKKCPQKLIHFYERHLRFSAAG